MRTYLENFFNYLHGDTMWCEDSSGDVESPMGAFSLVEIPENERDRLYMFRAVDALTGRFYGDREEDERPDAGWYVVVTDSGGFTYWDEFRTEEAAREVYDSMEADYAEWED